MIVLTVFSYSSNSDDLVTDFVSLTSLVTRESLQAIEAGYKDSQETSPGISFPQLQTVASRFLGRLWAGSSPTPTKPLATAPPQPITQSGTQSGTPSSVSVTGTIRRTPSKQSMASTLNSIESASDASTLATEVSSQDSKRKAKQQNKDSNLHNQIEDLLVALTDMQREQAALAKELQKEREEREEDQKLAALLVGYIKEQSGDDETEELLAKAAGRFSSRSSKRLSSLQTKQQLREDMGMWKEKYEIEAARCQNLGRSIDEHEQQEAQLKEELQETRGKLQESHDEKQQLEQTVQELRSSSRPEPTTRSETGSSSSSGLEDLKAGETSSTEPSPSSTTTTTPATTAAETCSKRLSSLGAPTVINAESYREADEDSLLVEVVNAKTAEAVALQELDVVKAKLEATKKTLSQTQASAAAAEAAASSSSSTSAAPSSPSPAEGSGTNVTVSTAPATPSTHTSSPSSATSALSSAGSFFTSWTRRNPSTTATTPTAVENK